MSEQVKDRRIWYFLVICVAIILWFGNWYFVSPLEQRGTFGDMFGAVNSIFSGCAFIGVAISVFMQNDQLTISRKEVSDTKRILDKQQQNIEKQNEANLQQMFEVTFFRLLENFLSLVDGLNAKSSAHEAKQNEAQEAENLRARKSPIGGRPVQFQRTELILEGKAALVELVDQIHVSMESLQNAKTSKLEFQAAYTKFFNAHSHTIGHYFRTLYILLKFVDEKCPTNKYFYVKLVRAQLTSAEATLLALNYLSAQTTPKMNALTEKYGLCKNAEPHKNRALAQLEGLIPKAAFGRTKSKTDKEKYLECKWVEQEK